MDGCKGQFIYFVSIKFWNNQSSIPLLLFLFIDIGIVVLLFAFCALSCICSLNIKKKKNNKITQIYVILEVVPFYLFVQGDNYNRFGGWLGKNSTMGKNLRLLEDTHVHILASQESNMDRYSMFVSLSCCRSFLRS